MDHDTGQAASCVKDSSPPFRKNDSKTETPPQSLMSKMFPTPKGVENAKKRLRAFSIQKKTPLTPVVAPKPSVSGSPTVYIGKLSGVKSTPKMDEPDPKAPKLPKPPKPGTVRKALQDSYTELQRRTLADIEDMKRKMELVDLGIPLGLICPSSTSDKAMPTKAMPPIKSFIDPAKVDELIREAKKAKMEGKEFKFDYQKLLPGYDNPFQRKKDDKDSQKGEKDKDKEERDRDKKSVRKKSDFKEKREKYSSRRYSDHRREDKIKERVKERSRDVERKSESKDMEKETDVNFSDYLVCDSWSLDNDEKTSISSPKYDEKSDSQSSSAPETKVYIEPSELLKASIAKKNEILKNVSVDKTKQIKLQPVIDSFKYEIDENDEEVLDIFDSESTKEKFATVRPKKLSLYDSPDKKLIDLDDSSRDLSLDGINDDTFLESVINEIKVGELSEDESQDKGLVEYEMSPNKDDTPNTSVSVCESVTPELVRNKERKHTDYSDGYRSSESGYKTSDTVESGYKSGAEFRLSIEKELDDALNASKMSKATVDSLETWTFVMKICQPLLFRHDKNKCYKETRSSPKLWYTTNPKSCSCVKDRGIVYEELEMCKMTLVDRVYGCDQIPEEPFPRCRGWYPAGAGCLAEGARLPPCSEWEADDSQPPPSPPAPPPAQPAAPPPARRSLTPKREELALDREYQRFMEAVWPDVIDSKKEGSRSTTPVQENRKKRKEDSEKREEEKREEEKRAKKIKLSSEGWSQESDVEEDDRSKKVKGEKEKTRKRKHSTSMSSSPSDSEEDSKKKKKALKRKAMKKVKSKSAKRRRMGKKLLKKLKEKQRKNKKIKQKELSEDDSESDSKTKKAKKKKLEKSKKKEKRKKKKAKKVSSTDTSSSTSSDSEIERKKTKKKKEKNKKKRKQSSSESNNEELFDVNILNNIKTEKTTDDEGPKLMEFSPRRQKPREIINVKELQNDFVGNTHIKEEAEEKRDSERETVRDVDSEIETVRDVEIEKETVREVECEIESVKDVEIEQEPEIVEESQSSVAESIEKKEQSPKDDTEDLDLDSEISVACEEDEQEPTEETDKLVEPIKPPLDENSQSSSQESIYSVKQEDSKSTDIHDNPVYEKDESHLRPSSQNSNYSFKDVMSASQPQYGVAGSSASQPAYGVAGSGSGGDRGDGYRPAAYEEYERLAMAYQSDVAKLPTSPGPGAVSRIETVVRVRSCGEIKCDWRADAAPPPAPAPAAPGPAPPPAPPAAPHASRWGLKPGEVNIVLTGGEARSRGPGPVYRIQSLANRSDNNAPIGYDEAYMDTYGASDRLQYGDCFSREVELATPEFSMTEPPPTKEEMRTSTLDDRINQALRETVLGDVAKELDGDADSNAKGAAAGEPRGASGGKRVRFADGYAPGQDSDTEPPPSNKRRRARRVGCAWPCPASHPDHVSLWDALPPPPPPPGSPPSPPPRAARRPPPPPPPPALAPHALAPHGLAPHAPHALHAPHVLAPHVPHALAPHASRAPHESLLGIAPGGFMPPEPPPGLLALH